MALAGRLWVYLGVLALTSLVRTTDAVHISEMDTSSVERYTIELRIYVDKWAFEKWDIVAAAKQTWSNDNVNITTQVQHTMKQHIRAIMNGVNNIYTGLMEHGITIDVRIADVHFIMDEIVAETEDGSGEVSNQKVLDSLSSWLKKRTEGEPLADHTMLLTGLNITGNSSDADSLGVARLGEMCDAQDSLSVVEFLPPGAQTTLVVAHELGHSLNASHDGEGNMTCTNNSYVMDARVNHNSTNSYIFSPCSAFSIRQFLLHLRRSPHGSCLSASRTTVPVDSTAPALGNILSLDHLCQMEVGPQSFFHRGSYGDNITVTSYSTVCTSVWCSTEGNFSVGVVSADGFSCDRNKVCRLGICVESEEDINVSDSCPFGDAPLYANVRENVSCSGLAVSGRNASLCYSSYYQRSCCESCAAAYQEMPDCEYGDKTVWCATSQYPDVCHDNDKICCASCLPFNETRVGCEYGDKASWCASGEYPYVCDLNAHICCESCLRYFNESRTGCEYGDKAAWCATLDYPMECYGNDVTCCASCPPYHNASRVGCEYGDRAEWCSTLDYPRDCYRNDNSCCASCLPRYNASRLDCEYGDKAEWCATLDLPRGCYGNDEVCCSSCLDLRNASNVDCEYGDKADWCGDADYPYVCSLNAQVCCQSCLPYYNGSNTGCEYGDRVPGCEDLTLPQACYKNAHLCCHICRPFYQPSAAGCEYGDKATWCRQSVATDPSVCELNSEVCCASCSSNKGKSSQDKQTDGDPEKWKDEL